MFDFLLAKQENRVLPEGTVRRHYRILGRVQGVGFRYRARYAAQELRLTGWVENMDDGSVEMELQGLPEQIDRLLPMVRRSDWIFITSMRVKEIPTDPAERGFSIRGY